MPFMEDGAGRPGALAGQSGSSNLHSEPQQASKQADSGRHAVAAHGVLLSGPTGSMCAVPASRRIV